MLFAGKQLEAEATLGSCGVSDDSQMYVLMRLMGGAKKRKKKTYTKPKKQKHKHKKIKLRVLKFYKVRSGGSSVRDWVGSTCLGDIAAIFTAMQLFRVPVVF